MKREFETAKLIAAAISGKLSEQESQLLEKWQKLSPRNYMLFLKITKGKNIREAGQQLHKYNKKKAWNNITTRILPQKRHRLFPWPAWGKYAALLLLGAGSWMLYPSGEISDQPETVTTESRKDTLPKQGIILRLANGDVIDLKNNQGWIKNTSDQVIATNSGDLLSYRNIPAGNSLCPLFNEIYINRGETYQLELADGTHVTLNSMSKITYPANFSDSNRMIELEGEAYFQVSRDTVRPFIIKVKDFEIKVLGTQFNVTAYPDDYRITTTLIEGSVQLESPKFQVSSTLKPNEQLQFDKLNRHMTLEQVDVNYATAWLENKIRYRDIPLGELMTVLERWYDIKVIYENPEVKNLVFGCNFSRMESINQIIEIFEQTGKIKIHRSGKTLTFRIPLSDELVGRH